MLKQKTILMATCLIMGASITPALADIEFVPQQDTKEIMQKGIQEDGAINYFASGQHDKKKVEEQKRLPSAAKIDGKAKLKVNNGKIIANTMDKPAYIDCSAFASETPENTPDDCKQIATGSDAPMDEVGTNDAVPMMDEADVGNAPAPMSADGQAVKKTSIMDRKSNVQTNIISNTDTGVNISE